MGFSKNKLWFCRNRQKLKILLLDATEVVRLLKTLENCFLLEKKIGFSKKKSLVFSETAKSINQFDAECNWISKISQNVQNFCFFFWKNRDWYFEKILAFPKIAKSSKVALQGHWKSKNSQNVPKTGVFPKKMDGFFRKEISYFSKNW